MNFNKRLGRLIDLVPYITKHQGIAVEDLAKKFGVSVKELESDLWLLYCCGLPGQTPLELMEFSFEDGFVSVRNADELKEPRSLTKSEIASLVMGLEILSQEGSKIAESLSRRLQEKLRTAISIKPDMGVLHYKAIEEAIQKNQVLEITYQGKTREIIPFELYTEGTKSYLLAYCKVAKSRRTFKLDRIETLRALNHRELPPNEVSSADKSFTAEIQVHSQKRTIKETFGGTEQITYYSPEWLTREVLALGGAVEVLTPEIRRRVHELAEAGKNLYLG